MADYVINSKILDELKVQCNEDPAMYELVKGLVYDIANQEGKQWKDLFQRKILYAALNGDSSNED